MKRRYHSCCRKLKFSFTTAFTNTPFDANNSNNCNGIQPKFLIGTFGCIGARQDASDVHLVMHVGRSPSVIDFIQDMGQCGRQSTTTNSGLSSDLFTTVFSIHNYVYQYERIFMVGVQDDDDENVLSPTNMLMSKHQYTND